MKPWRILSLILTSIALPAQVIEATGCVHKEGDDPSWARPDLDDRNWQTDLPASKGNIIWTRCRIDLRSLPANSQRQINVGSMGAWELFVDGSRVAVNGDIRTGFARANAFYLDPMTVDTSNSGEVLLALRKMQLPWPMNAIGVRLQAGTKESIASSNAEALLVMILDRLPTLLFAMLTLFASVVLLILFRADQSRKELLWFGIACFSVGLNRLLSAPFTTIPLQLFLLVLICGNLLFLTSIPLFFFALAAKPLPRSFYWIRMIACSIVALLSLSFFANLLTAPRPWLVPVNVGFVVFQVATVLAPAFAFWPYRHIRPDQRVLAGLSLLWMAGGLANGLWQLPGFPQTGIAIARNVQSWLSAPAVIAIFFVIASRYRRISLDRAELQNEMLAAQEVQRLLTASTLDTASWATVDVAYLPAREVGGDFYFCRQSPAGQLVVVGDVSGKGLRAAMLASVALGSLRTASSSSPALVLQEVNGALYGQTGKGFVTCCAALLQENGQCIVANAGHPSPYLDGSEFVVEAGLPLGIVADATYQESTASGAKLVLVSDGIVEAENAQRELFGFERTREISSKPAQEIAEAAKAWGQTDDITVVTVRSRT